MNRKNIIIGVLLLVIVFLVFKQMKSGFPGADTMSIMDLREFKSAPPEFRRFYDEYIVPEFIDKVMAYVNVHFSAEVSSSQITSAENMIKSQLSTMYSALPGPSTKIFSAN